MNKLPTINLAGAAACLATLMLGAAQPAAGIGASATANPTFYRSYRPASTGGFSWANLQDIIATRDGGFLAVGRNSLTDAAHPGVENALGWMVKLNAAGGRVWERSYFIDATAQGITDSLQLQSAAQLSDDGFIALGGGTAYSKGALWLLRTDAAGAVQSLKRVGLNVPLVPLRIVPAVSNGALALAWKAGTDLSRPRSSPLLLRLSAAGDVLWQRQLGAASGDRINDAVALPDGGFLVAGFHTPPGGSFPWYGQAYLARLDANGGMVWQKSFTVANNTVSIDRIARLPDGSVMAALNLSYQIAFAHLSADGALIAAKTYRPDPGRFSYKTETILGLTLRPDGTLAALGDSVGVTNNQGQLPGYTYESIVIKLDSAGAVLSQKRVKDGKVMRALANFGDGQLLAGDDGAGTNGVMLALDATGSVDDACAVPVADSYPEVAVVYDAATPALASTATTLDVAGVSATSAELVSSETSVCAGVIPPVPTTDPRLTQKVYMPLARR